MSCFTSHRCRLVNTDLIQFPTAQCPDHSEPELQRPTPLSASLQQYYSRVDSSNRAPQSWKCLEGFSRASLSKFPQTASPMPPSAPRASSKSMIATPRPPPPRHRHLLSPSVLASGHTLTISSPSSTSPQQFLSGPP